MIVDNPLFSPVRSSPDAHLVISIASSCQAISQQVLGITLNSNVSDSLRCFGLGINLFPRAAAAKVKAYNGSRDACQRCYDIRKTCS